ncbi:protein SCO1/2 [Sphingomonas guangdongensis]|uniref:Protein SCO1/2 n=1 Tax=Sphingomonas guangdongensis TaxID=1141890 RepID=A0A285R0R7_9SPHN|nr:SCO family protein [Sphingomonas guangdongensis]SOB87681.1 protein SCO1/2 [Sphingomonas guangdongensis]
MIRLPALLALAPLAACSGSAPPAAVQTEPGGAFTLTDTNGRTVTDRSLRGKPYAIFFGFARCPDVCPTALARLALLHKRLGPEATRLNTVFVSVDPEHDKPADIASFLSMFDVPAIGLTGTPAQLAAAEKAYRVYVERVPLPNGDYTIDHTARIMLFDRNGRYAGAMDAAAPEREAVAQLRRLIIA